jgi:hypothetical protein
VASDNTLPAPSGSGDIFVLHMTAKEGTSGMTDFILSNVKVSDNSLDSQSVQCNVDNAQINIGQ